MLTPLELALELIQDTQKEQNDKIVDHDKMIKVMLTLEDYVQGAINLYECEEDENV